MNTNIHDNFRNELIHRVGETEAEEIIEHIRIPLKKSIFINTSKYGGTQFYKSTKDMGRTLSDPERYSDQDKSHTGGCYIDRDNVDVALGNTFLHKAGFFYIQEIAASSSAVNIDAKPGDIILDMAAAPGGKTSQLANKLLEQAQADEGSSPGLVIANDISPKRIPQLAHNINRGGYYNTAITKVNGFSFGKNIPNFFDHVLLDAPCSGEGTGFKSDAALKHRKQEEINKIVGTQFQLLVSAIKTCKKGGSIIYSTCTLNPFENELLIEKTLEFFGDTVEIVDLHIHTGSTGLVLEGIDTTRAKKYARCRPHKQKTGGFFIAKMIKKEETPANQNIHTHKLLPRNQFKLDSSKKLQKDVQTYIHTHFGIKIDESKHYFVSSKEKVYICSPTAKDILQKLHLEKIGIPILKTDRFTKFRPTHYLGNILGHLAQKNTIDISSDIAQRYVENKEVTCEEMGISHTQGEYPYRILTRNKVGFSLTKLVKGELKNKFGK